MQSKSHNKPGGWHAVQCILNTPDRGTGLLISRSYGAFIHVEANNSPAYYYFPGWFTPKGCTLNNPGINAGACSNWDIRANCLVSSGGITPWRETSIQKFDVGNLRVIQCKSPKKVWQIMRMSLLTRRVFIPFTKILGQKRVATVHTNTKSLLHTVCNTLINCAGPMNPFCFILFIFTTYVTASVQRAKRLWKTKCPHFFYHFHVLKMRCNAYAIRSVCVKNTLHTACNALSRVSSTLQQISGKKTKECLTKMVV